MEVKSHRRVPFSHGALKRDLMKIVGEQSGSSISQYFTLSSMKVDPEKLTSEVSGTLHTVVGSKAVTAEPKTFRFFWAYSGLSLQLKGAQSFAEPVERGVVDRS